ncbi:hypothetical protein V8C26DRAFT_392180 [Trichoderma gracile]
MASSTLSREGADSSSSSGKSRMSWLYFCAFSLASFRPVSATKLTVAWKRLACLRMSRVRRTPSLLSWSSMPSSADSMESQKLTSWLAVLNSWTALDDVSLVSLVMPWMDLIQVLTLACSLLRKLLSWRRFLGIASMDGFVPATSASSRTFWMSEWNVSEISGMSTFCWRWSRLSSRSLSRFLVTGIPVLASTSLPLDPLASSWLLLLASK